MSQIPTRSARDSQELSLDTFIAEGMSWTRLIAGPVGVSGVATLFTLFGTTVLYRELPADQAGQLAVLLALLETVLLISLFGQLTVITRLHSKPRGPSYRWRSDLRGTLLLSWPAALVVIATIALLYDLSPNLAFLLAAAGVVQIPLAIVAYMLNANRHYILSNLLLRLPNSALALPAALVLLGALSTRLSMVLLVWILPTGLFLLLGLHLAARSLPNGEQVIRLDERLQGLTFLGSSLVSWMPEHGVVVLAGLLLPPAQLASYAAMAVFLRVFKFLESITAMVMTPELIKRDPGEQVRLAVGLGSAAVAGGLAMVLLAPPLARLIYGGRYSDGLSLIPFLALAGSLQLFSVLPRSHLAGQSALPHYRRMILVMSVATGIALGVSLPLIMTLGLLGMALALMAGQLARSGSQITFWLLDRRSVDRTNAAASGGR